MRKFTLLVLTCIAGLSHVIMAQPQWQVPSNYINMNIYSVYFFNESKGWVVGDNNGLIRTTSDGGETWESQTSPSTNTLRSVFFISETKGWAVGNSGTIITTSNGGSTWTTQTSGTSSALTSVYFVSETQGYAVGGSGTILTTSNGGANWTAQTSGVAVQLNSVYFASSTHGWAIGNTGTIVATTNAGANWSVQTSGVTNSLSSVFFISSTHGWAVGASGTIVSTTNGGANWASQPGAFVALNSVFFTSTTHGYAVGDGGVVMTTTTGGTSWTVNSTPTTKGLLNVYFASPNNGVAVGMDGVVLKTTNAGANWVQKAIGVAHHLNSVIFTNATDGFVFGASTSFLKSSNGGDYWITQPSGIISSFLSSYFISPTHGWVVGTSGKIMVTTNGGINWSEQNSGNTNTLNSVFFASSTKGWAVGESGLILATTDGGDNWVTQISGITSTLNSVFFVSETTGWAVGLSGVILYTSNGGATWSAQTSGTSNLLWNVRFVSQTNGWAIGAFGTILTTSNGGGTWSTQTSGVGSALISSYFTSETEGWIVGQSGTILKTVNAGANWTSVPSGTTRTLRGVYFFTPSLGWAVGDNGTVLLYKCLITPQILTTTPDSRCGAGEVTLMATASEGELRWFDSAAGGNLVGTGESITKSVSETTSFWVEAVNGECSSLRVEVVATVNSIPSPPTGEAEQEFCNSATISNLVVSGESIKWYTLAEGGEELLPTTLLVNGAFYYSSQTINGCESTSRFEVEVAINVPDAPTGEAEQEFCNSAAISDLVVNGEGVKWYPLAEGGEELLPTTLLVNGAFYYSSQTINGCESTSRFEVEVAINVPDAPTGEAEQEFCNSAAISDLVVNGEGVRWYPLAEGGEELLPTTLLVNGAFYYSSQTINGCESTSRFEVEVAINVPDVPTGEAEQEFCNGSMLSDIIVTGQNILWYSNQVGGDALDPFTNLSGGQSYYASQTVNGCESANRLEVTVLVAVIDNSVEQVDNALTAVALGEGYTYQWVNCNTFEDVEDGTSQTYTPTQSGSYAVIVSYYGCLAISNCFEVTVTDINDNNSLDLNLSVYPNPSSGRFIFRTSALVSKIEIFNASGSLVQSYHLLGRDEFIVDLSGRPSGVYFFRAIYKNNGFSTGRLIVK